MKVAVIGGGINGIMTAWALVLKEHSVELLEQGQLMGATSSASTKLLHGGLRYLEHGHIRLVQESLRERDWWMIRAPHLAKPMRVYLPIYKESRRPKWIIRCGLKLYDLLAGQSPLAGSSWHSREELLNACEGLRSEGLKGAFSFYDVQMDDNALGLWAAERAREAGAVIRTETKVYSISTDATLIVDGKRYAYDSIVNVAGPWAKQILDTSGIAIRHDLDLVRGSHLILDHECACALLLQAPIDGRICFILPYQEKTLVGSTEVRQTLNDPIRCSSDESIYLQKLYRFYFPATNMTICGQLSGLRPLVRSHSNPNKATREYVIERSGKVISVLGGKWTTSRSLGLHVAEAVSMSK